MEIAFKCYEVKSLFDNNGKEYKFVDIVYPVGSIYMSVNNVSPASFIGGTWTRLENRFLLGASSSYGVNSTGGEVTHTLTESEMPSHVGHLEHNVSNVVSGLGNVSLYLDKSKFGTYGSRGRGWNAIAGNEMIPAGMSRGGSQPHNNMPPYLAVYMWKRTS